MRGRYKQWAGFVITHRHQENASRRFAMAKRPKIRHLAIITLDPERLAKFYEQTFEMTRLPQKGASGSKAIYLTDGYITLALLENKAEGKPPGLNHFGWQVDDQDEIARRLTAASIKAPGKRP